MKQIIVITNKEKNDNLKIFIRKLFAISQLNQEKKNYLNENICLRVQELHK
jgi:hypothetical protein